jgi:hypothetical protein
MDVSLGDDDWGRIDSFPHGHGQARVRLNFVSLDESHQHHDDRDYQQNVNEAADCVRGYEAQKPGDDEN